MKRIGLFLLAVVMVGMAGCGGGGGGNSGSGEFDPTGSEWQFLVATADAGDTMYTLSFFDSTGAKAVSGVFTAVNASGTSYSGSWASSGNVVTGASSGNFAFTLNVNDDTTTGTIDYVTPEGSGSSAATRTDTTSSNCSQYAGNWAGTVSPGADLCPNATDPSIDPDIPWSGVFRSDCTATISISGLSFALTISGDKISGSVIAPGCDDIDETVTFTATFSGSTLSGTLAGPSFFDSTWSGTKQ